MMTAASMMQGCIGAVVDGGIRDVDRIKETGFKVWSRYRTPRSMAHRFRITDWEIPIKIGETEVSPGDLVFGDMDGVVVVPREIAHDVLIKAEGQNKTERGWREIIASGLSPEDVVRKGGKF
jgi:regulator of RNase E activity RraA